MLRFLALSLSHTIRLLTLGSSPLSINAGAVQTKITRNPQPTPSALDEWSGGTAMVATTRALLVSCFHGGGGGSEMSRCLSLRPRYPSMPRRPKGVAVAGGGGDGDLEAAVGTADEEEEEEKVAVFSVSGMTCAACAGSVEKAVKRLPGIHDAAVDVLWGRAQVVFCPAFVSVSSVSVYLVNFVCVF